MNATLELRMSKFEVRSDEFPLNKGGGAKCLGFVCQGFLDDQDSPRRAFATSLLRLLRASGIYSIRTSSLLTSFDSFIRNHCPTAELEDALRSSGQIVVVRDDDQRGSESFVQLEQQMDNSLAGFCVQVACRLIRKKNLRPVDERPGQRNPLLFAS